MPAAKDIIVVAASLGGIDALSRITSTLPANLRASLIVVLHTSADSPRHLAVMIGRHTDLEVSYGSEGEQIAFGHLYIASPDCHLMFSSAGLLHLDRGPPEHFHRPAADVLFRSAAKVFGPRVIGVVLTGGDADGAQGCKAIEAAGGIVVVQEPAEAKDPSMPLNVIKFDHPNFIATLENIGPLLISLIAEGMPQ